MIMTFGATQTIDTIFNLKHVKLNKDCRDPTILYCRLDNSKTPLKLKTVKH